MQKGAPCSSLSLANIQHPEAMAMKRIGNAQIQLYQATADRKNEMLRGFIRSMQKLDRGLHREISWSLAASCEPTGRSS
jgi:hypothetical protein